MNMKDVLLLLSIAFISLNISAQTTIANGNMESWTGSGSTSEPQYWNSNMTGGGNASTGGQTCFQEATNPHGGTYCAKVKTGFFIITTVNGSLTTGKVEAPTTNKSDGYIHTIPGDPNFGMNFTGRPDSLVFWYRYDSYSSDYPNVEARLHVGNTYAPETPSNGNHPDSSSNIVARAKWLSVPNYDVTTWTRISLPFVYVDGRTPQYILITTTSSGNQTGGTQNSTLWLDDFEAIYNPTIATGSIAPLSYYVSATTGAAVNVPFTLTGTYNGGNTVTAQLSDASGSFASPVTIGSVSATASGTISATIPANTAAGTGYRIRVVSSSPVLTAANNGADISVIVVSNSIAPTTTQIIGANTFGQPTTVTETPAATSREWKYSAISGGGYQSFAPAQMSTSYTPNFPSTGTYYLVCESSFPGGLTVTSNEVVVTVVANSIAPASPQSILVGVNGTMLTVTETPAGSWREWLYSTTSGSGYVSFAPPLTGAFTYTPNFAAPGNYYVIAQSIISGVTVFSNEVLISVGNATIATGTVSGSPFLFSPSTPDASISVPFTTSGTFNSGNIFTAQLSDANGSFSTPVNIGTLNATASGTITASVPHTTAAGTGYRIRVISDNPVILGSDNGADLVMDQFNNSVAPATTQTIQHSTNGTAITVTASQTATTEWKYSTTSGSGYVSFAPAATGSSYTPNFPTPGTYYVVAVSTNTYSDAVTSNEVEIDVTNGNTITTSTVNGSPFLISPSMSAPVSVNFTSDVVFNAGNVFKAQLSDNAGSFASPVEIGTLSGSTIGTISAAIPVSSAAGTGYRIRVVSTDPAVVGSDNGNNLTVVPFEISIAPVDTQHLVQGQNGTAITITETQPATRVWKYSQVSGIGYAPFSPSQTGTSLVPHFNIVSPYYIIVESTNSANDKLTSQEVVVIVTPLSGIEETKAGSIKAYWSSNDFVVDLTASNLSSPVLELVNINGQTVVKQPLSGSQVNRIPTNLPEGVYVFRIMDGEKIYSGTLKK
jgi:hypothetical protein